MKFFVFIIIIIIIININSCPHSLMLGGGGGGGCQDMLRWSGQNANQKVGPDKMPTTEKKSRTKCQPRLAFCPVGILSGWHLVHTPDTPMGLICHLSLLNAGLHKMKIQLLNSTTTLYRDNTVPPSSSTPLFSSSSMSKFLPPASL